MAEGKYSLLTPQEKEEYNYKFKDTDKTVIIKPLSCVFGSIIMFLWVVMGTSIMVLNELDIEIDKQVLIDVFNGVLQFTSVALLLVGFIFVVEMVMVSNRQGERQKWIDSKFEEVRKEVKE